MEEYDSKMEQSIQQWKKSSASGSGYGENGRKCLTNGRMRFSDKLNKLREDRRIGQRELGQAVDASGPTISRWENGVGGPSFEQAIKLAKIFGVDIAYLADDDLDEPSPPASLPADEDRILSFYRSLKRTGALDEDLAISGLASVARAKAMLPPGESEWETVGIRDRTAGDNANITRQNRQAREQARKKATEKKDEAKKGRT